MKKKIIIIFILLFIIFISAFGNAQSLPILSGTDQQVADAYNKYFPVQILISDVLGLKDINQINSIQQYGITSILIISFIVWLIVLCTFSNIIISLTTLSNKRLGWIIGAAMTIIAANLKGIQALSILIMKSAIIFGAMAVFVAMGIAFIFFVIANWGSGSFARWAHKRKQKIHTAQGIREIHEGIKKIREIGRN